MIGNAGQNIGEAGSRIDIDSHLDLKRRPIRNPPRSAHDPEWCRKEETAKKRQTTPPDQNAEVRSSSALSTKLCRLGEREAPPWEEG
jgi:hypothetical protein